MEYLIVDAEGAVITNTRVPSEAESYLGAAAVSLESLGIVGLDGLPAHPVMCKVDMATLTVTVDQAKVDAALAESAAADARRARIDELIAATNPADVALAVSERMFRVERLRMGLSEEI